MLPLTTKYTSSQAKQLEDYMKSWIVGQDRAIRAFGNAYQLFASGLNHQNRPAGSFLLLGPTGVGKTISVETFASFLYGVSIPSETLVLKVDCAEFQHSHEISKLIGSPSGYLGHRETPAALNPKRLESFHTERVKLTIILFDEIEKAADSLWTLLLGVLDKARLTLGTNEVVNFQNTMIFMTSNLGAKEMTELVNPSVGFSAGKKIIAENELDQKVYQVAIEAARRKFSPEFMNRIDKVVVFRTLKEEHLRQILDLEIEKLEHRIFTQANLNLRISLTEEAKQYLLQEGLDPRYGARHMRKTLERKLLHPISGFIVDDLLTNESTIAVDVEDGDLLFCPLEQVIGEVA